MTIESIAEFHRRPHALRRLDERPANDNLTFGERVKAEIAAAAEAAGVRYSQRELIAFAMEANAIVKTLRG